MNQQAELKEPSAENPATIFLAPACNVDERCWCKDDQGPCDECGEPTVKYRRADLVDAEIARLRAEAVVASVDVQRLRAEVARLNEASATVMRDLVFMLEDKRLPGLARVGNALFLLQTALGELHEHEQKSEPTCITKVP